MSGDAPKTGNEAPAKTAGVYGPKALAMKVLACPDRSGESGSVDYDVKLMKKHCTSFSDKSPTGPAAIVTFDGEEVVRAELEPDGRIRSCVIIDKQRAAALAKSRFKDFATACK